jgi:hypothetical protein
MDTVVSQLGCKRATIVSVRSISKTGGQARTGSRESVWCGILLGAASITLQHGISTIAMIGHLPLNLTTRHEKISWYQAFVVHIAHAR